MSGEFKTTWCEVVEDNVRSLTVKVLIIYKLYRRSSLVPYETFDDA